MIVCCYLDESLQDGPNLNKGNLRMAYKKMLAAEVSAAASVEANLGDSHDDYYNHDYKFLDVEFIAISSVFIFFTFVYAMWNARNKIGAVTIFYFIYKGD